tara:strand:+ start:160 stop:723 length:564 start_codon:yes stop_codon:yes gene_type:complete
VHFTAQERMQHWSEDQAHAYFEGVTDFECITEPTTAPAAATTAPPASATGTAMGQHARARRPRILCLHGSASNADIFKLQLAALRKVLEDACDLFFLEGERLVLATNVQAPLMREYFGEAQSLREYMRAATDTRGWRTYEAIEQGTLQLEVIVMSMRFFSHSPILPICHIPFFLYITVLFHFYSYDN